MLRAIIRALPVIDASAGVRISASTIESYRTCPRKFWYQYVNGMNERAMRAEVVRNLQRVPHLSTLAPEAILLRIAAIDARCRENGFAVAGFDVFDRICVRVMPATLRGTWVHAALEAYYRGRDLDPHRNVIDSIAFEALPHLPPRGEPVELEREFRLEVTTAAGRVIWSGRKDLETAPMTYDHKTTKDAALYAKIVCGGTSVCEHDGRDDAHECLVCHGLQSNLYALEAMVRGDNSAYRPIRWNYLQTDWTADDQPSTRCFPREGIVTRERAEVVIAAANVDAMAALALTPITDVAKVPVNPAGCDAFGGCAFASFCPITPLEKALHAFTKHEPKGLPMNTPPPFPVPPPMPPTKTAAPPEGFLPHPSAPGWWYRADGAMFSYEGGIVLPAPATPPAAPFPAAAVTPAPAADPMAAFRATTPPDVAPAVEPAAEAPAKGKPGRKPKVTAADAPPAPPLAAASNAPAVLAAAAAPATPSRDIVSALLADLTLDQTIEIAKALRLIERGWAKLAMTVEERVREISPES